MDDFVLSVKQIAQFPLQATAAATDAILLQQGGIGGAYKYTTPLGLLDPLKSETLTAGSVAVAANLGWVSGPQWLYAGQNVALIWTDQLPLLTLAPGGSWLDSNLSLTAGTLTVTRDPTSPLEVATQQFVLNQIYNSGVRSFNGLKGDVCFGLWDLVQLGVPSAQNAKLVGDATLNGVPIATIADVKHQVESYAPLVNLFNGRAGVVELQLVDVMNVFFAGVPITPTPRSSDISQRIANTRWVTDRNEELYGSLWADVSRIYAPQNTPHLYGVPTTVTPDINDNSNQIANTQWVLHKLTAIGAGVLTWNNRSGLVNMVWQDVEDVGGAPIASPVFTGNPQAPTRVKTDNSASIATTAFVQAVAGDYLPLAGGTLTGPVTGTALTLSGALAVAGATALAGILGVVGAATFDATLDVTGAVDFADTLDVAGAVTFADTLDVTGLLTGKLAEFTTTTATPAITAKSTAAGAPIYADAGTGNGILVDGRLTNGISIIRNNTAGFGLRIRSVNAGVGGTGIYVGTDGTPGTGIYIGSGQQANAALQVERWTPDTTVRWQVNQSGAQFILYDGTTAPALDINSTSTGDKFLVRNGATNNLRVKGDGTLDSFTMAMASGNTDLIFNTQGNANNNIIGRKNGNNRWRLIIGNSAAETGADSGSNYALLRSSDAGVESVVAQVMRDTGRGQFLFGIDQCGPNSNTILGTNALANNTAQLNTAVGWGAMQFNTSGNYNTAIGRTALRANTTGEQNVAVGNGALASSVTGGQNVAVGEQSLYAANGANNNVAVGWQALFVDTTGSNNTAIGTGTLKANTTGGTNTAVGYEVLRANTTGGANTGMGIHALAANTTGANNCAFGSGALQSNTTAPNNCAFGQGALGFNTIGSGNNAFGYAALSANTTANACNAFGRNALGANTTGINNVAIGHYALGNNTTARYNIGIGGSALITNTTGEGWVAIGDGAASLNETGNASVVVGLDALRFNTAGNNNTAVGYQAGEYQGTGNAGVTSVNNSIYLGYQTRSGSGAPTNEIVIGINVVGGGSNTVTLGNAASTAGYRCQVAWTVGISDLRGKEAIEMVDPERCIEAVRSLPVKRWKWRDFLQRPNRHEVGWTADDVEKVFPKAISIADEYYDGHEIRDCKHHNAHHEALPVLWAAVQRLIERLEALERKYEPC